MRVRDQRRVIASAAKQSHETSYRTDMPREYCVYILTNDRNTVLYTGVTNDLKRRVFEHREKLVAGF
ncbi:MAG: GIY-YIG nuclease family protein, partial [Desulfomonilaceae bacterium]